MCAWLTAEVGASWQVAPWEHGRQQQALRQLLRRLRSAGYEYVLHSGAACDARQAQRWVAEEAAAAAKEGRGIWPRTLGRQGASAAAAVAAEVAARPEGWAGWCRARGDGGVGELTGLLAPPGEGGAAGGGFEEVLLTTVTLDD